MSQSPPPFALPERISGPTPEQCDYVLGAYMRQWGSVELSVVQLIHKLLETDVTSARIVILTLGDMKKQRELATELGKHRLSMDDADKLEHLLNRVQTAATHRNRIVHGKWVLHMEVQQREVPEGPVPVKSAYWGRLYEPTQREDARKLYEGKDQKMNARYKFSPDRIAEEARVARALAKDIDTFSDGVRLLPARVPKPVEW